MEKHDIEFSFMALGTKLKKMQESRYKLSDCLELLRRLSLIRNSRRGTSLRTIVLIHLNQIMVQTIQLK